MYKSLTPISNKARKHLLRTSFRRRILGLESRKPRFLPSVTLIFSPPSLTSAYQLVRPATMAEHSTHRTTTDRLEEAIAALSERHSDLANKVEAMCECLSHLTTPSSPVTQPSYPSRPSVKLDVPRFDGYDPLGWIFKISQFFEYQGTPEEERIMVASFYLDGPALSWFQWMFRNGFITSWPALLQAIEARFAPSFYDDP